MKTKAEVKREVLLLLQESNLGARQLLAEFLCELQLAQGDSPETIAADVLRIATELKA